MSAPKVVLEGLYTARGELVIVLAVGDGVARRICNVSVPTETLMSTDIGQLIDRAARRRLVSQWSDIPLDWE